MATLYDIDSRILECFDSETGELLDEEKLNELQIERKEKFEGVACAYKNLISDAEAIRTEINVLKARLKTAEKKAEGYKTWLGVVLGGEAFDTARCSVSFRRSEETVPGADFIEWAMDHDRDDLLTFGKPTANKTAIKAALLGGEDIPAEIVQKNNINIK